MPLFPHHPDFYHCIYGHVIPYITTYGVDDHRKWTGLSVAMLYGLPCLKPSSPKLNSGNLASLHTLLKFCLIVTYSPSLRLSPAVHLARSTLLPLYRLWALRLCCIYFCQGLLIGFNLRTKDLLHNMPTSLSVNKVQHDPVGAKLLFQNLARTCTRLDIRLVLPK